MVFTFLKWGADIKMEQRLEVENFSDDETVSFKIPISLPYQIHNQGYEKVSGKFEHDGEFYNLVKQKIEKDTLYVVCIRNTSKKNLSSQMEDFENSVNDYPSSPSSQSKKLLNSFIKDYIAQHTIDLNQIHPELIKNKYLINSSTIFDRSVSPFSPPPEFIIYFS